MTNIFICYKKNTSFNLTKVVIIIAYSENVLCQYYIQLSIYISNLNNAYYVIRSYSEPLLYYIVKL